MSCRRNALSINVPWPAVCSEKSGLAGLVLPDAVIKQLGGSLADANEDFCLPYHVSIIREDEI